MDHDGLFASRYFGTSIVEIVRQEEHNIYRCVPKKGSPILEFWYVNASGHTYVEGTGENAVTKTRVNAFSDVHAPWKWKRSLRGGTKPSTRRCNTSSSQKPDSSFDSCVTVPRAGPATVAYHMLWRFMDHYLQIIDVGSRSTMCGSGVVPATTRPQGRRHSSATATWRRESSLSILPAGGSSLFAIRSI
jgi:hypothetical protein